MRDEPDTGNLLVCVVDPQSHNDDENSGHEEANLSFHFPVS